MGFCLGGIQRLHSFFNYFRWEGSWSLGVLAWIGWCVYSLASLIVVSAVNSLSTLLYLAFFNKRYFSLKKKVKKGKTKTSKESYIMFEEKKEGVGEKIAQAFYLRLWYYIQTSNKQSLKVDLSLLPLSHGHKEAV